MISVLGKGYEILYNFFCDNLILGVLKTELFLCLDGTQTKGTNSSRDQSSQRFGKQSATPSKIVRSKGLTLSECCLEMRIFIINIGKISSETAEQNQLCIENWQERTHFQ